MSKPPSPTLYHNSSKIHFNGQIYTHQTLPTLFKTLPASDYRVESWDCQPVAGAVANTQITETNDVACHLMVSGTVTFEGVNLDEASSSRGRGRGRGGFNNYNSWFHDHHKYQITKSRPQHLEFDFQLLKLQLQ